MSLPINGLILILFAAGQIPGALWAGAITPVIVTRNATANIEVPTFSNATWLERGSPPSYTGSQGIFSFEPQFTLQGLILNSAASASPTNGSRKHPAADAVYHNKLDNTGYTFVNRSFGVGSSVGLSDSDFANSLTAYSYEEVGLHPVVRCTDSEPVNITFVDAIDTGLSDISLFQVTGSLPNGYIVNAVAANTLSEPPVFVASGTLDTSFVAFAVGPGTSFYARLRGIQCQVSFSPQLYTIKVDVTNSTIAVSPVQSSEPPSAPPNSAALIARAVIIINAISDITGTSVG